MRIEERDCVKPGFGEVEIRLAAGGICGSDLHYYNHGGFGTVRLKEPLILGHEVSGHIAALGEGVSGLAIGDLVAVSPSRPCGSCHFCLQGHANHCSEMRFYGSAMPFPHIQGAFRERLVAKASQCIKAEGLTAGEAAMAEPLSVALHATRRAGEILGKRVLVTGCGPIGALSIMAARRAGAAEIIAADISEKALAFAQTTGADRVVNLSENPDNLAAFSINKGYFDILYECSGAQTALVAGMQALRPRGIVIQLGLGGEMNIPMMIITAKELDIRGSFRFHEEFSVAVQLMQRGLINVKSLITHSLPLHQALEAFELASDKSQSMKTQIAFG